MQGQNHAGSFVWADVHEHCGQQCPRARGLTELATDIDWASSTACFPSRCLPRVAVHEAGSACGLARATCRTDVRSSLHSLPGSAPWVPCSLAVYASSILPSLPPLLSDRTIRFAESNRLHSPCRSSAKGTGNPG